MTFGSRGRIVTVCVGLDGPKLFLMDPADARDAGRLPAPVAHGVHRPLRDHNNNYAPVTLGTDGTAYVGVLGGLIGLRDAAPPPSAAAKRRHGSLRLRVRRMSGGRIRARVVGKGVRQVRRVAFRAAAGRCASTGGARSRPRSPRKRLRRHGRTRIAARIVRKDGTRVKRVRRR